MGDAPEAGSARIATPRVRAEAKTVLIGGARFLGPGVVALLDAVEQTGSVKQACAQIGLSYTKGWRLIHTLEAETGAVMVARRQGGSGGGTASLTPECRTLLARFRAFSADVDADVAARFAAHFPEFATPRD